MTKHKTKEERRREILESAAVCFAEKGYYETTMDDVVRAVGLSKGALYWYFENKRDLFRTMVELWLDEMVVGMSEVLSREGSASDKLRMILSAIDASSAGRPELGRAFMEFYTFALRDSELRPWFEGIYDENFLLFRDLVQSGIDQGEFVPTDAGAMARTILAGIDGVFLHQEIMSKDRSEGPSLSELADTLLSVLEVAGHGSRV